jgi:adenylate cyclase
MDREALDPEIRGAFINRLVRLGARPDEIEGAERRDRLAALAIEYLVAPDHYLTLDEVAERAGTDRADAMRLWRAWGLPPPEPDDRRFNDVDIDIMRFAMAIETIVGSQAAFHTARVMGVAMSRVAEAEIAMLRSTLEAPMRASGASDDEVFAAYEAMSNELVDVADKTLGILHHHHLVEVVRRQLDWSVDATPHNVLDVVVGFADLTGSTRLASRLALEELDHALAVFEERTSDIIATAGASLVKRIGDAVMFTTPAAEVGAHVALELVRQFEFDGVIPPVRVGLAAGTVVARRGDFYGLPVALAARLQSATEPSTILVDGEVARRLAPDGKHWTVRPAGTRDMAGFAEPVPVHALRPSEGSSRA